MIDRFRGPDGIRRLVDALTDHILVCGEPELAEAFASTGKLEECGVGHRIIEQGAADNDLFLILSGAVAIQVNGRTVAKRGAREHVGEMAVIDPRARRGATVLALEPCVITRITEPAFAALGEKYPRLWRRIAKELAGRLRNRNDLVRPIREQAQLFIGSSREGLPLTDEIAHGLLRDPVLVRRWTNNVFVASHYPLEDLETSLAAADLALLIATPDDVIASRGSSHNAPRDNIVFELGLFMGALGRRRSFLLRPRGVDLKLPTDLLGLTPIDYDADTTRPLDARMTPVCHELRRLIATLGPI